MLAASHKSLRVSSGKKRPGRRLRSSCNKKRPAIRQILTLEDTDDEGETTSAAVGAVLVNRSRDILPYMKGSLRFFGLDADSYFRYHHSHVNNWNLPPDRELIGMVPISLLAALISDLRKDIDRGAKSSIRRNSRSITKTSIPDAGRYCMFNWGLRGGVGSFRESKMLSEETKHEIDQFTCEFVCHNPFIDGDDTTEWVAHPGIVVTETACDQDPHLDVVEGGSGAPADAWILHVPLQPKGAMFSVWDYTKHAKPSRAHHCFVHVPFGSYLALRIDVYHSGFYGSPGSARFHMAVTNGHCLPGNSIPGMDGLEKARGFERKAKQACMDAMQEACHSFSDETLKLLAQKNVSLAEVEYPLFCAPSEDLKSFSISPPQLVSKAL